MFIVSHTTRLIMIMMFDYIFEEAPPENPDLNTILDPFIDFCRM